MLWHFPQPWTTPLSVTAGLQAALRFSPAAFFYGLLPPIVFAAGFTLKKRDFFRNFGTISVFAVPGTFISALFFGFVTYGLVAIKVVKRSHLGTAPLIECLLYGKYSFTHGNLQRRTNYIMHAMNLSTICSIDCILRADSLSPSNSAHLKLGFSMRHLVYHHYAHTCTWSLSCKAKDSGGHVMFSGCPITECRRNFCLVESRGLAHLAALGLVLMMLHCVIVKSVKFIDPVEMRKTDSFGETRPVLHVPSSS